MPVCIAGMHRSGTSMVARSLNLCGLYLGEKQDMLPEAPDNPAGFWEHTGFLAINNQILALLGGAWNTPPEKIQADWPNREEFAPLKAQARQLLQTFAQHNPWGWKDPRTCLTLKFWLTLLPDLKVVICLRSPLEVAHSLKQREVVGLLDNERDWVDSAHRLWRRYYQQLWQDAPATQRLVTHYEAFFHDPASELQRLLDFLNMPVVTPLFEQAVKSINSKLYRQRYSFDELIVSDVPLDALEMYFQLCEEAGHVFQQTDTAQSLRKLTAVGATHLSSLKPLSVAILQSRAEAFRNQEEQLKQRLVEVERANRQLAERDDTIRALRDEVVRLNQQLNQLQAWKTAVTSRISWRVLEKFWVLREKIMPYGKGLDRLLYPLLLKLKLVPDDRSNASVRKSPPPKNANNS